MKNRIADFHNDLPAIILEDDSYDISIYNEINHTDIPRLKKGKVSLQFFAACPCNDSHLLEPYKTSIEMIKKFKAIINNTSGIEIVYNNHEILEEINKGNIAAVLAIEGGHAIENSLEKLEEFYFLGARYLTITWNNSNDWAVSALDEQSEITGLNDFGREVIKKMNSLKMMIDVSHTGIKTINDILEISTAPIIATHTGVRKFNDHPRNLYDEQIKNIAASGGVVGIVFYPPFLNATGIANLEEVINHIDYIASLVGVDFLSLGSDFDGIGTNTVNGLEDVSKFPVIIEGLIKRGFHQDEIEKIIFQNALKIFKNICG